MSDPKHKENISLPKKKHRDRGKLQDVMRKQTFSSSLDNVLHVKKAPILEKQIMFSGVSFRQSENIENNSAGCSLNESVLSAMSLNNAEPDILASSKIIVDENVQVPCSENLPSKNVHSENLPVSSSNLSSPCVVENLKDGCDSIENRSFDETLLSYDEETFPLNTSKVFFDQLEENECLGTGSGNADHTVQVANASLSDREYAEFISSAVSSSAFLETLAEDSSTQIELLKKIRDEELTLNKSLRSRVTELESLKSNMDGLVADLESSYEESYAELKCTYQQEIEAVRMDAKVETISMENQITDLAGKLIVSEGQNVAKDELINELNNKITDLERVLEEQKKHCYEELEGMVAKIIKNDSLVSAKNEVEEEVIDNLKDDQERNADSNNRRETVYDLTQFIDNVLVEAENEIGFECGQNNNATLSDEQIVNITLDTMDGISFEKDIQSRNREITFDRAAMVADFRRASLELSVTAKNCDKMPLELNSCARSNQKFVNDHSNKNISSLMKENQLLKMELKRLEEDHVANSEIEQELSWLKVENDRLNNNLMLLERSKYEHEECLKLNKELLAEKEKWLSEKKSSEILSTQVKHLEITNSELESRLTDMKEKLIQAESLNNTHLLKRLSLDSVLLNLQKENKSLLAKNEELEVLVHNSFKGRESVSSSKKEIEAIQRNTSREDMVNDVGSAEEEIEDLQCSRKFSSLSRSTMNFTTDATHYLEFLPAQPVSMATQTDVKYVDFSLQTEPQAASTELFDSMYNVGLDASGHAAVRRFTAEEFCPSCRPRSGRRSSLDRDLQTSWTERCEVEQQLIGAMAENEMFRKYITQLEKAGLHASALIEAGVPSPSAGVWLQLCTCIKQIVGHLKAFRQTQVKVEGKPYYLIPHTNSTNPFDTDDVTDNLVGRRSSPEGGRESPRVADVNDESEFADDADVTLQENNAHSLFLDKTSEDALLEMVQDLLRCLGSDDINCSVNTTLSSSLCEKMATLTDAGELCRCWQQVKDEVARISALSRRMDPNIAKLQEEVRSLELQVNASDKQLRLNRAFLDEQAAEREVERDEATQRIAELIELVRTKDRQLAGKDRLENDLKSITDQLTEVQVALKDEEERRVSAELTLEQTLEKVASLREIIESLELESAKCHEQLEVARADYLKLQQQLLENSHQSLERENAQRDSYSESLEYINRLEEQLISMRHSMEAIGPESIAFACGALRELETMVARRTRELELVQVAWNVALSSASEELSTRDHTDITRCVTPDEMASEPGVGLCDEVERLKERLIKHARVEEAALKRIKELEVVSSKRDELQFDLEAAMRRVDDLLAENGSIKARLEKERSRSQDQLVIADFEARIQTLEDELDKANRELEMERKLVAEKSRREERLQDALDSRESEFLEEIKALKLAQDHLKSEKAQRLALDSRVYELTQLFEEKNEIVRELRSLVEAQSRELSNLSQRCSKDMDSLRSAMESKILELSNLHEEKESQLEVLRSTSEQRLLELSDLCEKKDKQLEDLRNATELRLPDVSSLANSDIRKMTSIDELAETPTHSSVSRLKRNVENISPRNNNSASSSPSSSSSSSSKRVRFCNPESFVGSSLTPISRSCNSVMRDPEIRDPEWSVLEPQSTKPMPWQSVSSVSALHLSARDNSDIFYSPVANDSTIQSTHESFEHINLRLMNEVDALQSKLIATTESLESSEELYKKEIQRLEQEVLKSREKAAFDCQENEKARRVSEETVSLLKMEVELLQAKINGFETNLKSGSANEENEQQKVFISDLQSQVKEVTGELIKHKKEVVALNDILRQTMDELGSVKSARDGELTKRLIDTDELQNQRTEIAFLKDENKSLNEQVQKLNEKLNLKINELDRKKGELQSAKEALSGKSDEMARFVKEISAKVDDFERDNKRINDLELLIKEYEETIKKVCDERDHFKFDNVKLNALLQTLQRENKLTQQKSMEVEKDREDLWQKLFLDANSKVSDLRTCLEKSLSRTSSLEANLIITRATLDASEKKTETLESELKVASRKIDQLTDQINSLKQSNSCNDREKRLAAQLEIAENQLWNYRQEAKQMKKLQDELLVSKRVEDELKGALKTQFELEKDMISREDSLKDKLHIVENELLRLQYSSDLKDVNVRGLEKLHHHTLALRNAQCGAGESSSKLLGRDLRSVRSAGDGEDQPSEMKWAICRLESYRKALVWQKRFLQDSKGRAFHKRSGRRSLRSVAFIVIAIQRMRFLVRRWKHTFKLPPLVSPPRRERDGLPMLTSPPCKDTHRVNHIK